MSRRRDNADQRLADAIAPFERPAGQHHMSPLVGPDPYLGVRQKLAAKINLTYCGQRTLRREPFGGWVWLSKTLAIVDIGSRYHVAHNNITRD